MKCKHCCSQCIKAGFQRLSEKQRYRCSSCHCISKEGVIVGKIISDHKNFQFFTVDKESNIVIFSHGDVMRFNNNGEKISSYKSENIADQDFINIDEFVYVHSVDRLSIYTSVSILNIRVL